MDDASITPVSGDLPSRREAIQGLAAASLCAGALEGQTGSSLCFLGTVEMARLIRTGRLSAREALAGHLQQIARVNPKVNAIVTLVPELAADADEMAAHRETLGPLPGLPVAHKDLLKTAFDRPRRGGLPYAGTSARLSSSSSSCTSRGRC